MNRRILEGIQVLDLTNVLSGPFTTLHLALLGAEVIKIENPKDGDLARKLGILPELNKRLMGTSFIAQNCNKKSITLNTKSAEGKAIFLRLAKNADVVVENFRPGVMERLGLDEATLRLDNPGLIYCSITGFGRGAGAALPGYDLLVQALGGLMSITGEPAGPPEKVGVALVDIVTGLFASTGILAALRYRDATGEGQRVDLDLLSSLLAALSNQSAAYTVAGHIPERLGNRHPSIAPYEVLRTADGDLVLAVGNDQQFAALCREIERPHLAGDPRFATNSERVRHRDELRAELEAALAAKPVADWAALLMPAGVPAGAVNDIAAAFALADDLGLEPTVEMTREDGTTVTLPRNPIGLSVTPASYRSAPPALGGA